MQARNDGHQMHLSLKVLNSVKIRKGYGLRKSVMRGVSA
jgi:hypothetical protein